MSSPPPTRGRHAGSRREEWTFTSGPPTARSAVMVLLRLCPSRGRCWYWCGARRAGEPAAARHRLGRCPAPGRPDWSRSAGGLWAEHVCEAPFEQWTVANETYAVALDDPDEALGRAYGVAAPIAFDLEWYATAAAVGGRRRLRAARRGPRRGRARRRPRSSSTGCPPTARTAGRPTLPPLVAPAAVAHLGLRAPARLPDGTRGRSGADGRRLAVACATLHRMSDRGVSEVGDRRERHAGRAGRSTAARSSTRTYGPAAGPDTTLISWSTAKSVTHALVGIAVRDGLLDLDAPAPVPEWAGDERSAITLRQLLPHELGTALRRGLRRRLDLPLHRHAVRRRAGRCRGLRRGAAAGPSAWFRLQLLVGDDEHRLPDRRAGRGRWRGRRCGPSCRTSCSARSA